MVLTGQFRNAILDVFRSRKSFRFADVANVIKVEVGEDLPQDVFRKIMGEVAVAKGATWTFKGFL